jgi:hypothetical protein
MRVLGTRFLERPVEINVENDKMATNVAAFRKHKLHISVTCVILEFTLLFNHVKTVNICAFRQQHFIILHRIVHRVCGWSEPFKDSLSE